MSTSGMSSDNAKQDELITELNMATALKTFFKHYSRSCLMLSDA